MYNDEDAEAQIEFLKKLKDTGTPQVPRKKNTENMKPVNRAARRAIAATKGKKNAVNR